MTALKAHEVSRFLNNPGLDRGVFLAYGPDQGLVRETAQRLMRYFAGPDPDPMAELTLDAAELAGDAARLAVEARTVSMFGGTRRIRIRNAGKALAPALTDLLAEMPDAAIILEAGNLPPRDALRALAESDRNARALPCYADNSESLKTLIRQSFTDAGISADAETIATIEETLGNDREVTRRELEKLILFAAETKTLTPTDVLTLCGDNTAIAIDRILDAAGTGQAEKLDTAIRRAFAAGTDEQRLLIVALQHFVWLRRLRVDVDSGQSPRDVLDRQRPRPHFSRKAALEQQLRIWNDDTLAAAANRLYEAIAESRKSANLGEAIAHRALLAISVSAAHR